MPCTRVNCPLIGRRRKMQDDIGQPDNSFKTLSMVEIGKQGLGAGPPPVCRHGCIAEQGKDPVAPGEVRKNAAGDVSAADDKYFLHGGIVADQGKQLDEPSDQRHTQRPQICR